MSRQYVFTTYGGPEGEELTERKVPEPGPGQVLIEVRAAGVNPVDWKIREGLLGTHEPLPVPMGREVAGVVTAVGAGVTDFTVGEEVLGPVAHGEGGFADHALLDAAATIVKPEEISFTTAAMIPVAGTTAYDLTHQIELDEGQTLLILGAGGGVGHLAAQIGAVHQFKVIGVASPGKRELVEAAGATFVAAGPGALAAVRQAAPEGADLLVDLVGGQPLRDLAPAAKSGNLIISAADGETAGELGGSGRASDPETFGKIADVIGSGAITPAISRTFPLDQAREALALVESGHAAGKVIIEP